MYVLLCLIMLLSLQACSSHLVIPPDLRIPTEPHREELKRARRYNVSYGFQQVESGEFRVLVQIRYRRRSGSASRSKRILLRLQRGTIVQRDPKTLVLRLDNRERVIGQHRWWYSPYWQAASGIRIKCRHYKRFTTVVVENCHLRLKDVKAGTAIYRPNRGGDRDDSDDNLPAVIRIVPYPLGTYQISDGYRQVGFHKGQR